MKRLLLLITICISTVSFGQVPTILFTASNNSICLGDSVVLTAELQVTPPPPLDFPYSKNIGNEIFVSPTGSNSSGDGSELNAYQTVQYAIGTAVNGDIITLQDGVYTGVGNVNISTQGKQLIVQSENGPLFTTIDCEFGERAFKINQGETMSTIIKGIRIINGQTNSVPTGYGSAIFVEDNSGLMVEDCFFENNQEGCIQFGDTETTGPQSGVSNCVFISNYVSCIGGSKKRFNVDNCFFYGNYTLGTLSGNAHVVSPAPIFSNCLFQCNSGQFGPSLGHGQIFQNSLFLNNQNDGGVIRFGTNFTGNASNLDHCTFFNNSCSYFNGTASNHTGLVTSTIFFPGEARAHVSGWQSAISFANCLGDGISGSGNIQGDPLFEDPNNFNFNLSVGSPCIGTGQGGSDMGADMSQIPVWMFSFLENYSTTYNSKLWENGSSQDTIVIFPNSTEYISISFIDDGCGAMLQNSILITVNEPTTSSIIESNCDTYTAPDGSVYTTTGNYTAIIPNAAGCDSTITIDLTITNSNTGSESVTECDSYTWVTNGQTYTQSGQFTSVLTNQSGCDSTVTLNLTITNSNIGSESVTECNSFTWSTNGQTYTQSGQYTSVLTNQSGCDSTVTLNLTITNSNTGSESVTECDSYTWNTNGQTYTQSGQYTEVLTNQSGCDSTVTLNLTIEIVDITSQPVDQTVVVGNNGQFTVTTSATNPTYQWQMDNGTGYMDLTNAGQYSGTDTDVLTISNVQFGQNNFLYRCIVTSGNCETISSVGRLTIQDNVGLDDINKNIFNVYPNPTSNSFTISSEKVINSEFTIIDSQGREVLTGSMNGQEHTIDISKLSKGVYSVVFDNTEYPVVSVIKE